MPIPTGVLPPVRLHLLKTPQTARPTGHQSFKYMNLFGAISHLDLRKAKLHVNSMYRWGKSISVALGT